MLPPSTTCHSNRCSSSFLAFSEARNPASTKIPVSQICLHLLDRTDALVQSLLPIPCHMSDDLIDIYRLSVRTDGSRTNPAGLVGVVWVPIFKTLCPTSNTASVCARLSHLYISFVGIPPLREILSLHVAETTCFRTEIYRGANVGDMIFVLV